MVDRAKVLMLFKGKAKANAAIALDALERSVAAGEWEPGQSRKVRAAMNKTNAVVSNLNRIRERGGHGDANVDVIWEVAHCLGYGLFERAIGYWLEVGNDLTKNPLVYGELGLLFKVYVEAMTPVAAAMLTLDNTRPKPTFTWLGTSPTVTATLTGLQAVKVEVCPMHWEHHSRTNAKGDLVHYSVAVLDWPEGTKHDTSPHSHSGNALIGQPCHACGHSIRNPFNWCPLVLWSKDGTPRSMYVGRDCAHTLFGVKLNGEMEIKR